MPRALISAEERNDKLPYKTVHCSRCDGKGKHFKIDNVTLRRMRTKVGLTQREMADKLGISKAHMSDLESGKRNFSEYLALKVVEVCGH